MASPQNLRHGRRDPGERMSKEDYGKRWALKRVDNMRRMKKEDIENDFLLFSRASEILSNLAHLQMQLGDDEAGMYIGVLANALDTKAREAKHEDGKESAPVGIKNWRCAACNWVGEKKRRKTCPECKSADIFEDDPEEWRAAREEHKRLRAEG